MSVIKLDLVKDRALQGEFSYWETKIRREQHSLLLDYVN